MGVRRAMTGVVLFVGVCATVVTAQWGKFPTPGLPRDAKGLVRMDAPAPRTADGKPDLSGVWLRADRDPLPEQIAKIVGNRQSGESIPVDRPVDAFPSDPNSPALATFWDIGRNIPGGPAYTAWAAELRKTRMAEDSKDNPDANCLPMGITQFHMQPQPRKIIQTPQLIVIEYEANYGLRKIYTDGRQLPKPGDPQPFWYGYSVGRWDGDTLIVETNNLRGAEQGPFDGWLDVNGAPYSDSARFIERFRRPIVGKLEIDVTIDDPKSYTKPWTVRVDFRIRPEEEMIEFVCNENQQFRKMIKID